MAATEARLNEFIPIIKPDILHAHSPVLNALPAIRDGRRHGIPANYEVRALGRCRRQPRIYPGSPWENGYNERFNGTLRREVLNAEWFNTTKQAQIVIDQWLRQYNHIRPHQALNMRPPVPETLVRNGSELGG